VAISSAARHLLGVQRQEIYPATSPSNAVSGMEESDCIQAIACHSAAVATQRSNVVSDMKSDCARRVWSFPAVPWRLLCFSLDKGIIASGFPFCHGQYFYFYVLNQPPSSNSWNKSMILIAV
jgi:hypothetical protein